MQNYLLLKLLKVSTLCLDKSLVNTAGGSRPTWEMTIYKLTLTMMTDWLRFNIFYFKMSLKFKISCVHLKIKLHFLLKKLTISST